LLQQPAQALPPHEQVPIEHVDELPHGEQATPPVPHELSDWPEYASHVPVAVQQPLGHDCALQTHWPAVLHV
jgi:hypothetical protein